MEQGGVAEGIAADLVGHEKPNITYNVYSGGFSIEQLSHAVEVLERRQLVKKFFTVAMGGDNEVGVLHACFKEGISKENFQKLKDASLKVFPKLELFNGWGIYAQNFEGQILKNVMLEGVKKGIVCLPVHDAVAVASDHIGWACDEMRYQWDKQMSVSGLARVTTDIPA